MIYRETTIRVNFSVSRTLIELRQANFVSERVEMGDATSVSARRVAIELDRLSQEIRVIQHMLDDSEPNCRDEMVRRLGHVATRAKRIAEMMENDTNAHATT
jgi:hypothetical protein